MSSGAELANGHDSDSVLRPRPRKPQHSQLRQLTRVSSNEIDEKQLLAMPLENGQTSGATRYSFPATDPPDN